MSASGSQPPGTYAHNLELSAIQKVEELRDLAETTENLDALNIGMMSWDVGDDISSSQPPPDGPDEGQLYQNLDIPALHNLLSDEHIFNNYSSSNIFMYNDLENLQVLNASHKMGQVPWWINECEAASDITTRTLYERQSYLPSLFAAAR